MYQQVFGCCAKNQDQTNGHQTVEVVTVENRFEGGTTVLGGHSKDPAIFLTPAGPKVQNETIWKTNAVSQPVRVVFTYTNRTNELRSVMVPSQQTMIQQQPPPSTIQQQQYVINDVHPSTITTSQQSPLSKAYQVGGTQSSTTAIRQFGYQQKTMTEQTIVRRTWQEHRQTKQEHLAMHNFNTFGPAQSIQHSHSPPVRQEFPAIAQHQRMKSPVNISTPIEQLQLRDNFVTEGFSQQTYFQQSQNGLVRSDEINQQPAFTATFPSHEQPVTATIDSNNNGQATTLEFTKKKPAMVKSKKQGKQPQKRDTSRSSNSDSLNRKGKELSAPHSKLESDKKRLTGVNSAKKLPLTKPANHQSDRLLQHRPCGRRHCTACQLKKKAQAATAAKLKATSK